MDEYQTKTYRVEWVVQVNEVDQYGQDTGNVLYTASFPDMPAAERHLNYITKTHEFIPGKRVWIKAPHEYTRIFIGKREVEINKEPELVWPPKVVLRDTKVQADEGQRIFTTATGYGYARQEYIRKDIFDQAKGLLESFVVVAGYSNSFISQAYLGKTQKFLEENK